jgi:flagellar hook assembly protein FlgD
MTTTSGVSGTSTGGGATPTDSTQAFRNADFLKIMLAEVTNQNPLEPQETSKLVDNMQKLQELANTTYQKFRGDIDWAQNMIHQTVSVQQSALDPKEEEALKNKGLKPDVGFQQVQGVVTSFRVVDQTVYVTVKDKDYPIDNVKQIVPDTANGGYLASMADQLLGKNVVFKGQNGNATGQVTAVMAEADGSLSLEVGGKKVPYDSVIQIGVATTPTTTTK